MTVTTTTAPRISYHRLTPLARAEIQQSGLTVAEYVRKAGWNDGDWHGDRCGCTDDRCIGHHHDENDDCGCLPVLIEEALGWQRPAPHKPLVDGVATFPNGNCVGRAHRVPPGAACRQCGHPPAAGAR